ncbi:hypothetical protein CK203_012725 [Vitis vinifera]|uniref:DUF4283 domain-containing protein n=1 Tax=Vitis vinifera TaxID=29760 RepID=A0A438KN19_VITVI|nr:hypothetical protein CK203_012725 [Vitis vinifera]
MFVEIERSLRVRKFLDWGAVDTRGAAGVVGCMGLPMENLWAELGSIKELWDYPWCVGEDFNVFRFPRERNRGERNHFSGLLQCSLSRPMSGHSPILLDKRGVRTGRTPFRFKNMWLKVWNKEVFGNVAIQKELALKQVGAELPIGEGQGGEFLVKFLDKRQGGEAWRTHKINWFI